VARRANVTDDKATITDLRARLAAAERTIGELQANLDRACWHVDLIDDTHERNKPYCQSCGEYKGTPHRTGCWWGIVLADLPKEEPT
jgi:hypothetical protein